MENRWQRYLKESSMQDDAGMTKKAEEFSEHGKTPVFFQKNGRFLGILAIADEIKPGWTR